MIKRKLTDEEKRFSRISIDRLTKRNERLTFFLAKTDLDMQRLKLDLANSKIIIEMKIEELQKGIGELDRELKENEQSIKTLNTQIREGVKEKENSAVK